MVEVVVRTLLLLPHSVRKEEPSIPVTGESFPFLGSSLTVVLKDKDKVNFAQYKAFIHN